MYVPPQKATREAPGDLLTKQGWSNEIEREIKAKITPQMKTLEIEPGRTTTMEVKFGR
jgi:hypothetical protein